MPGWDVDRVGRAAGRDEKSVAKFWDVGTLAGMTWKRTFWAVFAAAVLSAALNVTGFAQGTAAASQNSQQVFHITPVRPIAELRAEILKAKPPEAKAARHVTALADVAKIDPTIHLDIRYATANNFLGEPVYEQARAFLQTPAALALKSASERLHKKGYGLLLYDAYRPWYVTKIFWEATPEDKREFVADPAQGSSHNRGCAVDLTLYDLKTGAAVAMPSEYDEMTPRAYANYAGASAEEKEHRRILREAMEKEGFVQRPNEWWHYDYKDWQKYAILNLQFPHSSVPAEYADSVEYGWNLIHSGGTRPEILKKVEPEFSEEARRNHIEGTVVLSLVIDESGIPRNIQVKQSLGHGLDEKAVEMLEQWRFKAAK